MKLDLWQTEREQATVHESGIKYFKGTTTIREKNYPTLKTWNPKAIKPGLSYYYKSEQDREEALQRAINNFIAHKKNKEEYRESRKPSKELTSQIKKGNLFYTSWGYDQTNYDYVAVIEVSPTGKTVKCRRTSYFNEGVSNSGTCNVQEPVYCPFGETFRLQVRSGCCNSNEVSLVGSYPFLHTGEGSKRHGYFSKVSKGDQFHETDIMFGH